MYLLDFYNLVSDALEEQNKTDPTVLSSEVNKFFLSKFKDLLLHSNEENRLFMMTCATVLFEGFYRYLLEDTAIKRVFAKVRSVRWDAHLGTPTLPFLLSYKLHIDNTKILFDNFSPVLVSDAVVPWLVDGEFHLLVDGINQVIADPGSIARVLVPSSREVSGIFTKTHNPFGGFTTAACDPVSQSFIEQAKTLASEGGKVLEIGAAFGAATLAALAAGATVYCNDIDAENLAVVQRRFLEDSSDEADPATGDSSKLILIPGCLPDELTGLPKGFFDAILVCRVLHFFSGKKIEESLALLSQLLAPGGKIYIVCETPFLKNWLRFIPEFERRVAAEEEWPGEITNPADYESSGRAVSLPKFVHWITKEILERSLSRAGLSISHSAYIDRIEQFPVDLLHDGRESVGAIGIRN